MKKTKLFLRLPLLLLAALTLTNCSSDKEDDYLNVSVTELTLENGQGQLTVSSNTSWNITALPTWLNCSSMNGTGDMLLRLTQSEVNPSTNERSGIMTVKCAKSDIAANITVKQLGTPKPDDAITVNPTNVIFTAAGGSNSVVVTANNTWNISRPTYNGSSSGWLTVAQTLVNRFDAGTKTVEIMADENKTTNERTASITFVCGKAETKVTVVQQAAGARLTVNKDKLNFSSEGGEELFTVDANVSWTVSSSEDWCKVKSSGLMGSSNTVSVNVAKNEDTKDRTATITVKGESITRTVEVTQDGDALRLEVTVAAISFDANAKDCKTSFGIKSNTSWKINTNNISWLKVDPVLGSNDGVVTVTATEENTGKDAREATITVFGDGGLTATVTVTQPGKGPFLVVSTNNITFSPSAETVNVTVNSNTSWTVTTSNDSWLKVSPTKGSNNVVITVGVDANNEEEQRMASITVSADGLTQIITVTQEGISLFVSPTSMDFDKNGEQKTLDILCNSSWTVTEQPEWCTLDKTSGNGNGSVSITAATNNSTTERSGTLSIKSGNVIRTVTLHQGKQTVPESEDNPLPGYSRKTK